jgi:queuine tRNA-ribosyltransferase
MDFETSGMSNMTFSVLGPAAPVLAPRAGTLAITGRKTLSTPHYLPVTSRGVVPHISHDNVRKETAINGLYVGLEDCMCAITHKLWILLSNLSHACALSASN